MQVNILLLDRDGTLIEDKHYLSDPEGVALLPDVGTTLARLGQKGWGFFVLSNQSGVGRGYFSENSVEVCMQKMQDLLEPFGVKISGTIYCPHSPEDNCNCRKPNTGMWEKLAQDYNLHSKQCVMVGDKLEDLQLATNADLFGRVLVATGKGLACAQKLGLSLQEGEQHKLFQLADCPLPSAYTRSFAGLESSLTALLEGKI